MYGSCRSDYPSSIIIFSISDVSTPVKKMIIDWAFAPPEKFMSRLVLHLPSKVLAKFSLVCKRWSRDAQPVLRKRELKNVESKIVDFKKARKIYDAKRKVKAFINRDPNTMNPAQKSDLIRCKALLEKEKLYDLGKDFILILNFLKIR